MSQFEKSNKELNEKINLAYERSFGFERGQKVKVLRSSGLPEEGWTFDGREGNSANVKVLKKDGEKTLEKIIPIYLLKEWNSKNIQDSDTLTLKPSPGQIIEEGYWSEHFASRQDGFPQYFLEYVHAHHFSLPKNGARNLKTANGIIDGFLIYCDDSNAVFQIPKGKLLVKFSEIISPSGKPYGEIYAEAKKAEEDKRKK